MHTGTEQLLTIRDGGPVDAGIAQHVADCAECSDRLAELCTMRDALRDLPQLPAPADGWTDLAARLDQPAGRRNGWFGGAVAAAALIAVVVWQWNGSDDAPAHTDRVAETGPEPVVPAAAAPELKVPELVSQSRQLEQVLRELNSSTPRVMNATTAATIAGLQDGIAYIDYGLSYSDRLDPTESEQLWRQRVGLMNTLVQVRGAQLQQISN